MHCARDGRSLRHDAEGGLYTVVEGDLNTVVEGGTYVERPHDDVGKTGPSCRTLALSHLHCRLKRGSRLSTCVSPQNNVCWDQRGSRELRYRQNMFVGASVDRGSDL